MILFIFSLLRYLPLKKPKDLFSYIVILWLFNELSVPVRVCGLNCSQLKLIFLAATCFCSTKYAMVFRPSQRSVWTQCLNHPGIKRQANTRKVGIIIICGNYETKKCGKPFNTCEVMLLPDKGEPFQSSGCINRSLAKYVTQAVISTKENPRCSEAVPAVSDRQTDRWTDTARNIVLCLSRYWNGPPPLPTILKCLTCHLEVFEVKQPLKIVSFVLTNYMWNYAIFFFFNILVCICYRDYLLSAFEIYFFFNYMYFGAGNASSYVKVKHLRHWVPESGVMIIVPSIKPFLS